MTARVSFSSSSRGFGSYRCVPLHCPSSRQPYRSDNPCCSRACSTAQRRRSGLRSFPVPHPPAPASPATTLPPAASTGRSLSPTPSVAWPDPASAPHIPSATGSRSGCGFRLLCRLGRSLPVRYLYFHLPQYRYDLLRLVTPCRHDLTSSSSGFSLFPLGTKRAGQVKLNRAATLAQWRQLGAA